jgi:hypothetical protein
MKMRSNVKLKIKPTRRLLMITGICSILGISVCWFLFYIFSGTEHSHAGKTQGSSTRAYVENENLTDFEVVEARIRSDDDPVVMGTSKFKEVRELNIQ